MKEPSFRIENDDRGVYLDPKQTKEISFRVRRFGKKIESPVVLDFTMEPSGSIGSYDSKYLKPNIDLEGLVGGKLMVKPSDSENFSIKVKWRMGGSHQININFPQHNEQLHGKNSYYVVVKSFPDDNYDDRIKSSSIPWEFVYDEVLRYYYVIFPAMSLRFPLNFEQTVKQLGPQIIKRISDEYQDSTLFMPITRSMSPGKRKLLKDFLEQ